MKRICRVALVVALAAATLSGPAAAGFNPFAKLAVHVKPHGTSCTGGFPTFTVCTQITTSYFLLGDIDVIPVFYDLAEYTEVGMGIEWPAAWGSMAWTRCKGDAQTGTLVHPNDFVRISWTTCQRSWSIALGYGWLGATSAGFVWPSSLPWVADCQPSPEWDYACRVASAVGGYYGDDACVVDSDTDRSTWGAIKSIFRE
jgi:hypothetical protein